MLELAEIPFFAALSDAALLRIRTKVSRHAYKQGEIMLRAGEPGRYFHAIAAGAARVQPAGEGPGLPKGFILGPGQFFGEMSLLTGLPVAATLVAIRDTVTYGLDRSTFLQWMDQEPALHRALTGLLIQRLRYRTRQDGRRPGVVVMTAADPTLDVPTFAQTLWRGIQHYAPGSAAVGLAAGLSPAGTPPARETIETWRQAASEDEMLLMVLPPAALRGLEAVLMPEDVVVEVQTAPGATITDEAPYARAGAADYARVLLGERPWHERGRWAFQLSPAELARCAGATGWDRNAYLSLDHLARYITFCEVGVALSSGAARGFAHAGVLEALEAHGIPLDCLSGTSMGGITALTVAHAASAVEGARHLREFLGSNRQVRDTTWWPKSSVFRGQRIQRAADAVFGQATFADLRCPVAVVASDLIAGERVILDEGLLVPAVLGTSAVPGFLPPVAYGERLLIDGAIVSRVPVEALDRRRCGVRIAVNVVARQGEDPVFRAERRARLQARINRLFGFRGVLGAAWELLGSYGSTLEALQADIVITPDLLQPGGAFDFDHPERMIESGRRAALARVDAIKDTVAAMMRTGAR